MVDDDVGGAVAQLEEAPGAVGAGPLGTADVVEEVVLDEQALGLLAEEQIVPTQDFDAPGGMADDIVGEGDVGDNGPRGGPGLVAHGEQDSGAMLIGADPVVLKDVAVQQDPLGVFEFEEVLDGPGDPSVGGVADFPGQGFEEVVAADLDVGGDEVEDGGAVTAKHHVLARRFQVVVDDFEGAGAAPAGDGLGVGADFREAPERGIDHGGGRRVHGDAAAAADGGIPVDETAVEDQIVGEGRGRGFAGPEFDQTIDKSARGGSELDADEPEVMRARGGPQRAADAGPDDDLGQRRPRIGAGNAGPRRREGAIRGTGAHDDPPGAALVGERERARERRPGLQGDDIPSDGGVQGRLEIAAGRHRQRPARRGDVGRIENDAWTLRKGSGPCGGGHGTSKRGRERKHQHGQDCAVQISPNSKHGDLPGAEDRQFRISPSSAARLSGSSPDPWLCVPASRRVCPCRKGVSATYTFLNLYTALCTPSNPSNLLSLQLTAEPTLSRGIAVPLENLPEMITLVTVAPRLISAVPTVSG